MSNSSYLFKNYILTNTPVQLQFSNRKDLTAFMGLLRVLKCRYVKQLVDLGMEDMNLLDNKTLQYKILSIGNSSDESITVEIFTAAPVEKTSIQFKILE